MAEKTKARSAIMRTMLQVTSTHVKVIETRQVWWPPAIPAFRRQRPQNLPASLLARLARTGMKWVQQETLSRYAKWKVIKADRQSAVGLRHLHAGMSECMHTYTHVDAYTHANTCMHTK